MSESKSGLSSLTIDQLKERIAELEEAGRIDPLRHHSDYRYYQISVPLNEARKHLKQRTESQA